MIKAEKNNTIFLSITVFIIIFLISFLGILIHFLFGYSGELTSGHAFTSDDAFITYKYAENLFLGNGIVFNIGERVEGYSNFLYLIFVSIGYYFTTEYIYIYSVVINSLFLYASLFIFFKLININFDKQLSYLATLLLSLNPAIWANINTGLETIFVFFIFICFWYVLKKDDTPKLFWLFFLSLISILLRVDGFILPLIVVLYLFISSKRKLSLELFIFIVFIMVCYTLFRLYYYDDVIANTYYAKVSGDILKRIKSGFLFLYEESFYNAIAFFCIFVFYFIWKKFKAGFKNIICFELTFFIVWLSYILYIGGDIYQERFLLPFLALGIYFFIFFLEKKSLFLKSFLVILAIALSMIVFFKDARFSYEKKDYDMWIYLGKFLKVVPSDYILAIDAVGKVPFYSGLKTIDILGLNDKYLAKLDISGRNFSAGHNKFDVDYVLSKNPELIAAWINQYEDMFWDLTKQKYNEKYIIKYLVNTSREKLHTNIYDVENMSNEDKQRLIKSEFNYAVLARKDIVNNLPKSTNKILYEDFLKAIKPKEILSHISNKLLFDSWSNPEKTHRWSLDSSSSIIFKLNDKEKFEGKIVLNIVTLGEQLINIYLNSNLLKTEIINSRDITVSIPFDKNLLKETNTLYFEYANPHQPNEIDKRNLAMAIKSLSFE